MTFAASAKTRRLATLFFGAIGAAMLAVSPAEALIDPAHEFIVNGDFEQTTNGAGEINYNTDVIGWIPGRDPNGDYAFNFVLNGEAPAAVGAPTEYNEILSFWGPGNGSENGLTASPTGGNYIAGDGAYHTGPISQAIEGLIVGETYKLTFNYAGAQQRGYDYDTTEAWYYGLESAGALGTQMTDILTNVEHGFTGWHSETYNFVATQASDTLYFLAYGTPDGQPPFALLDSVSLTGLFITAPDPATWMTMLVGFGVIGASMRRRKAAAKVAALA